MLADMFMIIGMIFLLIAFSLGGAEIVTLVDTSFSIQNEAQAVAMSEGRYGGYTSDEQSLVSQYIDQYNQKQGVNTSEAAAVSVSAPGAPVIYGTNITATITVPFNFQIGSSFMPSFLVNLTGIGRSVSSYTPGITPDVTYVSP